MPQLNRIMLAAVVAWSAGMVWLAAITGPQHDYLGYLEHWQLVLDHKDPWSTDNAYGPLHNALGYLLAFGPLAPKALIVGALLVANLALFATLGRNASASALALYVLFVPANFVVFSMGVTYAVNDALVAALVVAAIFARRAGLLALTGVMLGLAAVLKFYPVFLVPLFALDHGRIRPRLAIAAVLTAAIGMAIGFAVWHEAMLKPFAFGAGRGPTVLSILASLRFYPVIPGGKAVVDWLIQANAAFVVAVAAMSVAVAVIVKLDWLEASVFGMLAVLVAYKVGHPQFYLPWLFLAAAVTLSGKPNALAIGLACLPVALSVSLYQWGYAYATNRYWGEWEEVRRIAGFLFFPIGLGTLAALVTIFVRDLTRAKRAGTALPGATPTRVR